MTSTNRRAWLLGHHDGRTGIPPAPPSDSDLAMLYMAGYYEGSA